MTTAAAMMTMTAVMMTMRAAARMATTVVTVAVVLLFKYGLVHILGISARSKLILFNLHTSYLSGKISFPVSTNNID